MKQSLAFASILTIQFTFAKAKNTRRNRRALVSCDSRPPEIIDKCQDCLNSCSGLAKSGGSGCKCESECMFGMTHSCSHLGDDWRITDQRCCPSSCSSVTGNDCIGCYSCTGYDHPEDHRDLEDDFFYYDDTFHGDIDYIFNAIHEDDNDHYSSEHRSTQSKARSTGFVIGMALLVIALVGSIAGVVFYFVFYKRRKQQNSSSDPKVSISAPVEAKLVTPQCEKIQDPNNVPHADVIADKVESLEDGSIIKTITATSSSRQVMTISERTLSDGTKEVSTSLAV